MKNFYIIDNNILYSSGLESILRSQNYNVLVNHGHHEDEHAFKEIRINKPDLIIMDLNFPKFNGIHFIHRLQEYPETNIIPIAVYTSDNNRHLMEESFIKGIDHFFIKEDFPPQLLIERLFKLYRKKTFIPKKS